LTIKTNKRMTNVVSALTARTQFGQIIRRTNQKNERFLVDRRGEPTVIIMSVKDCIDTIAPTTDWLEEIGAESKRKGLHKMSMRQIDAKSPPPAAPTWSGANCTDVCLRARPGRVSGTAASKKLSPQ